MGGVVLTAALGGCVDPSTRVRGGAPSVAVVNNSPKPQAVVLGGGEAPRSGASVGNEQKPPIVDLPPISGSVVVVDNIAELPDGYTLQGNTRITVRPSNISPTATMNGSMANTIIGSIGGLNANLIPIIPWPPPEASARADITAKVMSADRSHGAIDRRLREVLSAHGYSDLYYFTVPTGGFVVMTRAERIDDAGKPLVKDRWLTTKQTAILSAPDYVRKLIYGDDGRLRILTFVVSARDFQPQGGPATDADVQRWRSTGQPRLSEAVAGQTAPKGASITLLVYEFQLDRKEARLLEATANGLPVSAHLASLGLGK